MIVEGITIELQDSWLTEISLKFPEAGIELIEFQPSTNGRWRGVITVPIQKIWRNLQPGSNLDSMK